MAESESGTDGGSDESDGSGSDESDGSGSDGSDSSSVTEIDASFYLSEISATAMPSGDDWVVLDSSASATDFAGFSAAIASLADGGRAVSVSFPNLALIPDYAIFGAKSTSSSSSFSALVGVSADVAISLGDNALYGCSGLKTLEMPSATTLGALSLYECSALETIKMATEESVVLVSMFMALPADTSNITLITGYANYSMVDSATNTITIDGHTFTFKYISVNLYTGESGPPAEAEGNGWKWEVVDALTDEFDEWDTTKWQQSLWNYDAPVQMIADNSGVDDGMLWIKATLADGVDVANDGSSRWFETCRVMSKTKIKFPMYIECSMRAAHISAYNTFWLNNGDSNDRDEIDICENNSNPSDATDSEYESRPYTMHSQYFIVKDGVTERSSSNSYNDYNVDNRTLSSDNPAYGKKWNEEFQTFGLWWKDEHNVQFYINGEPAESNVTVQEFTLEQSVIWDLWTSYESWFGGVADSEHLKDDTMNTMYIDWVRTYQLVESVD